MFDIGLYLAVGFPLSVIAGYCIYAMMFLKAHKRVLEKYTPKESKKISSPVVNVTYLPENIKAQVVKIEEAAGLPTYFNLAKELTTLAHNVTELFKRLDGSKIQENQKVAAVEYSASLNKLNMLIGENYYLDIKNNPHYWDVPDERMKQVEDIISALNTEVVSNIRQVNISGELEFTVAISSLLSNLTRTTIEETYSRG